MCRYVIDKRSVRWYIMKEGRVCFMTNDRKHIHRTNRRTGKQTDALLLYVHRGRTKQTVARSMRKRSLGRATDCQKANELYKYNDNISTKQIKRIIIIIKYYSNEIMYNVSVACAHRTHTCPCSFIMETVTKTIMCYSGARNVLSIQIL